MLLASPLPSNSSTRSPPRTPLLDIRSSKENRLRPPRGPYFYKDTTSLGGNEVSGISGEFPCAVETRAGGGEVAQVS